MLPSAKTSEAQKDQYHMTRSPGRPVAPERHPYFFILSSSVRVALWSVYLGCRFWWIWRVQNGELNTLWRDWIVLFAELLLSVEDVLTTIGIIYPLFTLEKFPIRPSYCLTGSSAPTIDVCVTCCGEPAQLVANTLAAAAVQDYPPDHFRILLLDDGHDTKLEEATDVLAKKHMHGPRILYRSRKLAPGMRSFFKAGNLQYGLKETEVLGASQYFAVLDADMIPESDWLRRVIPHLILDDKVALACPPQTYYNVPKGDPLGQQADFTVNFTLYEPLNERANGAMCTGSGFIVRRTALENIGGWPLVEAGEDYMCSALLSSAGWKIVFVRDDLQCGLAPESLSAHVKQQIRWIDCGISVHKSFGFYLPGMGISMPWTQRMIGIVQVLKEYLSVPRLVVILLLPIVMFPSQSEGLTTRTSVNQHGRFWLRILFLAAYLSQKLNTYVLYRHVGLGALKNMLSNRIWGALLNAHRCIMSFLPNNLSTFEFIPSGAILSSASERSRNRKPLLSRLSSPDMIWYAFCVLYSAVPLLLRLLGDTGGSLLFPLSGGLLGLLECALQSAVPVVYMAFPPTIPVWSKLVEVDEHGVGRPRRGLREVQKMDEADYMVAWWDLVELMTIYMCDWY